MDATTVAQRMRDAGYIAIIIDASEIEVKLKNRKVYALHLRAEFPDLTIVQNDWTEDASVLIAAPAE